MVRSLAKATARAIVTSVPFPDPHAIPPLGNPCVGKAMQEGLAYVALLTAFNAMETALAANNMPGYVAAYATYRTTMEDFVGKWNSTEMCLHGWPV